MCITIGVTNDTWHIDEVAFHHCNGLDGIRCSFIIVIHFKVECHLLLSYNGYFPCCFSIIIYGAIDMYRNCCSFTSLSCYSPNLWSDTCDDGVLCTRDIVTLTIFFVIAPFPSDPFWNIGHITRLSPFVIIETCSIRNIYDRSVIDGYPNFLEV